MVGLPRSQGSARMTSAFPCKAEARLRAALLWPSPKLAVRIRILGCTR